MNESKQAMLELADENADERRMFDQFAETLGSPLLAIANSLSVQRNIMSIPGASFYEQSKIQYNELLKANAELAALRSSAPQADVRAALEKGISGALVIAEAEWTFEHAHPMRAVALENLRKAAAALTSPQPGGAVAGTQHSCLCGVGYEPCPGPDGKPLCAVAGTDQAHTETTGE